MAALTVPGAVDGWTQAHQRFGKLPFRDCLAPDWDDLLGHAQAIQVFPDRLEAASDPRSDGAALDL